MMKNWWIFFIKLIFFFGTIKRCKYEWISVLHHNCWNSSFGWKTCRLWEGYLINSDILMRILSDFSHFYCPFCRSYLEWRLFMQLKTHQEVNLINQTEILKSWQVEWWKEMKQRKQMIKRMRRIRKWESRMLKNKR